MGREPKGRERSQEPSIVSRKHNLVPLKVLDLAHINGDSEGDESLGSALELGFNLR